MIRRGSLLAVTMMLALALAAAGCASSESSTDTATANGDVAGEGYDTADDETAGAGDGSGATSTDDATGGADSATAAEPGPDPVDDGPTMTPEETVKNLSRGLFNVEPDEASIACVVSAADTDPVLGAALESPEVAFGQFDDQQLQAITHALNGCIDPLGLAGWATEAVGPRAELRDRTTECFAERFGDNERGDRTFFTFVALTLQYRVPPEGVPDVIDALSTCAPVSALVDFFANLAEAESGYRTEVDRECLSVAIDQREISEQFWSTLVEGLEQPVTVIDPFVPACTAEVDDDLAAEVPDDFVPWSGTGALAAVAPSARAGAYDAPPPMTIDPTTTYEAVLTTGGGQIRVRLLADTAPIAVNNFVNLARDGYYDRTTFHRVLPAFMAQGGDPTGTGAGGPGYAFADEFEGGPPLDRAGLLAMANTGPDTNGSQFFITVAPTDWLTGLHTVFGEVIQGQDIVEAIELRDPDAPNGRGQILESVRIIES